MNTHDYVIHTRGLSKLFANAAAVKALDLAVPRRSIFGFLGPNGAGKTTTMKMLLGLSRPTGGAGTILGMDIVRDSIGIRRRVGYLSQQPQFYDHMTARETLRFAARFFFSGPRDALEARIDETLELVGLRDKGDRPIKGFSGGERQRLGIGQAQINQPDLLILDEPAAALDPMGRRDVLEVMGRLREHTTIFYSTHILDDVQRVSDTVAIMNHGALVAQAPIDELLAGQDGVVYTLDLKGNADRIYPQIAQLPWVRSISAQPVNQHTRWTISVADEDAAQQQLLRLVLADAGIAVVAFGRQQYQLEDVFMSIVEGDNGR
jgi:ABC-2 type transport system ATP-binding protein